MEQSSIAPKRGRLTVQSIPAVAKDIFVWIVGPRRSVNYFNWAAQKWSYLLTYLFTCSREDHRQCPGHMIIILLQLQVCQLLPPQSLTL